MIEERDLVPLGVDRAGGPDETAHAVVKHHEVFLRRLEAAERTIRRCVESTTIEGHALELIPPVGGVENRCVVPAFPGYVYGLRVKQADGTEFMTVYDARLGVNECRWEDEVMDTILACEWCVLQDLVRVD